MFGTQHPQAALPDAFAFFGMMTAMQRQDIAGGCGEPAIEYAAQTVARFGVFQSAVARFDIDRESTFLREIVNGIFKRRRRMLLAHVEAFSQRFGESFGVIMIELLRLIFGGDQRQVLPDRFAVFAPIHRQRPSAAGVRPDTTCPGRNAGGRRVQTDLATVE